MKADLPEAYIQNYFAKNQKDLPEIKLEQIKYGLSNKIYKATVNDKSVVFKIYGKLKEFNLIDRKFEEYLIKTLSESKEIPKILETDYKNYAIIEFWENIKHVDETNLEQKEFIEKLIDKIIKFELSLNFKEEYYKLNIFNYLESVIKLGKTKFEEFNLKFEEWKSKNKNLKEIPFKTENLETMNKVLNNFNETFSSLTKDLTEEHLILSHNDIHKDNLVIKDNDLKIFDYEYANFNYIGADIINFFIEGFFDLSLQNYPFYKIKKDLKEFKSNKDYFNFYLMYLERLEKEGKIKIEENLKSEEYFNKIASLMSLFWFAVALLFLDFESNIDKTGFNYIDYSVDRLKIYQSLNL